MEVVSAWCFTTKPAAGLFKVMVMVMVKTGPRELALALLRQEVFVYIREDFGEDPVSVTAAVLL